jgi:glycerophosphodiester phosphodiesterase
MYFIIDVQLTRDYTPVIYHDWTITETGYDIPICSITLQQFLNLKKKVTGINEQQVEKLLDRNIYKEFRNGINQDNRERKLKRSNSLGHVNALAHSENREGKLKGNSVGTIQAPFTTLIETFQVNWDNCHMYKFIYFFFLSLI